jgi:hypothetical protein
MTRLVAREDFTAFIHLESFKSYRSYNETSGSVKDGEVLDWLSDYQILKKGTSPWRYYCFLLRLYEAVSFLVGHVIEREVAGRSRVANLKRCDVEVAIVIL